MTTGESSVIMGIDDSFYHYPQESKHQLLCPNREATPCDIMSIAAKAELQLEVPFYIRIF